MQATVMIGPIPGLQAGQALPVDAPADGVTARCHDDEEGDFAWHLPRNTGREQPEDSATDWVVPVVAIGAGLNLERVIATGQTVLDTAPAALDDDGAHATACVGGPGLPLLAVVEGLQPDQNIAKQEALDARPGVPIPLISASAAADPNEKMLPEAAKTSLPATERSADAAFFVPSQGPATEGAIRSMEPKSPPAAWQPDPVKAPIPAPWPTAAVPLPPAFSPRQATVKALADDPAPVLDQRIAPGQTLPPPNPETPAGTDEVDAAPSPPDRDRADASAWKIKGPDPTSLQADLPVKLAGTLALLGPIQPENALMMRFESGGQAVHLGPMGDPMAQTVAARTAAKAVGTAVPFPTGGVTLPRLAEPARPNPMDREPMADPALPTAGPAPIIGLAVPLWPTEGPKIVAPDMMLLTRHLVDTLAKGPDGETTLTLSPEELGKVRLSFRPDHHDTDRMVVRLGFDRPETMELFRRHADQLADALRIAGYAGVEIGFGGTGEGGSGKPPEHAEIPSDKEEALTLAEDAFPSPARGRIGTLAALDLRL